MADSTRAAHTKILLAMAGGMAVVAMGGLSVVFDQGAVPTSPAVASPVLPGPMTQGDTVTTTIAPTTLAIANGPRVRAKRYGG
jgi:hypothetical protein